MLMEGPGTIAVIGMQKTWPRNPASGRRVALSDNSLDQKYEGRRAASIQNGMLAGLGDPGDSFFKM
jgi:hypothetical protein